MDLKSYLLAAVSNFLLDSVNHIFEDYTTSIPILSINQASYIHDTNLRFHIFNFTA
jgi:hypothetical protein